MLIKKQTYSGIAKYEIQSLSRDFIKEIWQIAEKCTFLHFEQKIRHMKKYYIAYLEENFEINPIFFLKDFILTSL